MLGRRCFNSISVPSVKYDFPHRLRVPITDLLQLFRAQLPAQAVPVPVQLGKAQEPHRVFRQLEPLRRANQNKAAESIPLGKGYVGIMDIPQHKDGLVIAAKFGRIEPFVTSLRVMPRKYDLPAARAVNIVSTWHTYGLYSFLC